MWSVNLVICPAARTGNCGQSTRFDLQRVSDDAAPTLLLLHYIGEDAFGAAPASWQLFCLLSPLMPPDSSSAPDSTHSHGQLFYPLSPPPPTNTTSASWLQSRLLLFYPLPPPPLTDTCFALCLQPCRRRRAPQQPPAPLQLHQTSRAQIRHRRRDHRSHECAGNDS